MNESLMMASIASLSLFGLRFVMMTTVALRHNGSWNDFLASWKVLQVLHGIYRQDDLEGSTF